MEDQIQKPMEFGVLTYLSDGDKELMMKKGIRTGDPNSGFYVPSGGRVELYERGYHPRGRLEAAVRETWEETGLTVLDPIWRGLIIFNNFEREFPNWPNAPDFPVWIYSATKYKGELSKGSKKETPIWVAKKDIPLLPKNPGDTKMYEWLRDGRFFIGVIKHKGNNLDEIETWVDYYDNTVVEV